MFDDNPEFPNSLLPVINKRPESSYPSNVTKEMMLLSLDKDLAIPIGSYSYKIQKYPGDIDLFEYFKRNGETKTINDFVKAIQELVKKIIKLKGHYFMEIKCGIDERYDISIGYVLDNQFYSSLDFDEDIENLYEKELLSEEEMDVIEEELEQSDQHTFEVINEILRKHKIVRWTSKEILQGYKYLEGGIKYLLKDAVKVKSSINIETIVNLNGKLVDVSNFYVLGYLDRNGTIKVINLTQKIETEFYDYFINGLQESIEELAYSTLNRNLFKMVKRMWSYARYVKNITLIEKLEPIISGNIAYASQIKSDLSTIIKALKKIKSPPKKTIIDELSMMKERITHVLDLSSEEDYIDKLIDGVIENYTKLGPKLVANELEKLVDILAEVVEENTEDYLKSVGLLPVPKYLLPEKTKYV